MFSFFFFNDTATTEIYTLSLHDALPIWPQVLLDLAREAELDLTRFQAQWESGAARAAVLAEATLGLERYGVRGTPTLTLADGTHLKVSIAFPRLENRRIVGISKLPCVGAGCGEAGHSVVEGPLAGH